MSVDLAQNASLSIMPVREDKFADLEKVAGKDDDHFLLLQLSLCDEKVCKLT